MRLKGVLYISDHLMHLLPSLVHTEEQRRKFLETFTSFLDELEKRLGRMPWEGGTA
ncbi:hypothetical protein D3C81_2286600 [compost metagenome]